jgi:short-subunit dehydrogenase
MGALRVELAGSNIGVSVCCPGPVPSRIGDSERNRPLPQSIAGGRSKTESAVGSNEVASEPSLMEPEEVGRRVLLGIRNNDLYILTHPEFEQGIQDRCDALMASSPRDVKPPMARIAAEQEILRNPEYISERDRKKCTPVSLSRLGQ